MTVFCIYFTLLTATTVAVCAVPHFGYHYDRNAASSHHHATHKDTSSIFSPPASVSSSNSLSTPQQEHPPQQHQKSYDSYSGDKYLPPATTTQEPIITKQFFLVSAPDEEDEAPKTKHFVLGRPQKNYRVVFIKAPAPENANLKLTAEYAPQEEKTVIYVLSKKANEFDVGEIATPAPTQPTKPEVFFIKYKTHEEAVAAQKEIQEQYDHLGGTSEFSNEGVVPVKSVIGSLDGLAPNGGYDYKKVQNGVSSAIKDFLQPARFFY